MNEQTVEYARYKSRETSRWYIIGFHGFRHNLPMLTCVATDTFEQAMVWYRFPRAVCIARNGVIMCWRKGE